MNSPEQPRKQEGEMINTLESKEGLRLVTQTLREVAERFHVLGDEAKILFARGNTAGYTEKLRARAQLLIDLSDRITNSLEKVDRETRQQILREVSYFATAAQEALVSGGFSLKVLLTHMGENKIGDKNDLEKLIESLENK